MNADFFLDTNVLAYSFDATAERKRGVARALMGEALSTGCGVLSWQVVQEFCNLALRKFRVPMTSAECGLYADSVLFPLCRVWPTEALYLRAFELVGETGYSWYDCLILAAALESGARKLYTEDLQNGRKLGRLTIVDPFV
jgi:predicted nucleic acid-binding protein